MCWAASRLATCLPANLVPRTFLPLECWLSSSHLPHPCAGQPAMAYLGACHQAHITHWGLASPRPSVCFNFPSAVRSPSVCCASKLLLLNLPVGVEMRPTKPRTQFFVVRALSSPTSQAQEARAALADATLHRCCP